MSAPCWPNPASVRPAWPAGQGLARVEVCQAGAGLAAGVLPADVLLLCGICGNVGDRGIERAVRAAPALCRAGATVIWTRHWRPPGLTPQVRAWFAGGGFAEIAFGALQAADLTSVGSAGPAALLPSGCPAARSSPSTVRDSAQRHP